ncbi:MAG: DUF3754 domain-containing protein [Planctomycetales bacterium]|nr:DUF3754 domain-containing protein [Planctomycetales bacterium]
MRSAASKSKFDLPFGQRENFVPLHASDLVEYLSRHPVLSDDQRPEFQKFANLILALLHHLYRQRHEQLMLNYAALDPDSDRVLMTVPTDELRRQLSAELLERTQDALGRANYHRLAPAEIQRAIKAASQWGVRMRVEFSAIRKLEVYARGCVIGQREWRNWRKWMRKELVDVPLYQRLVVIFWVDHHFPSNKFDPRRVYLRMFKNVPQQDVDMMLPATGIQMSWIDHSKIVVPSVYAAAMTLWRFLRYLVVLTFVGVFKTVALIVLVALAIGFGFKSMFTYRINTKRRHMLSMTQSLYYQNLDNNAGVLFRLLDEGEQQEACEAVMAYFVTAILMDNRPDLTLYEIDVESEKLLRDATGIDIDFDVEDTARSLVQLGIMSVDEGGWKALPLPQAIASLDATWDSWYQ